MKMEIITTYAGLEDHWFEEVCLEGTYELVNTRMMSQGEPLYSHYACILLDKGSVLLGMGGSTKRSEEERETYRGKKVRIVGIIEPNVTYWGSGQLTSPTGPAIRDIKSITEMKH